MNPAEPRRDSFGIDLVEGAMVSACAFVPPDPRASVLCLPALGVPASYYDRLAVALAHRRFAVVTADLRGLGQSSVRPSRRVDFGYARLVDDAGRIAAAVRSRFASPMFLLGHSLGGHVGALLAGSGPTPPDGLVLTACGTPYWRRFPLPTGLAVLALSGAVVALGTVLGYVPGHRIGFGGVEAAQLMREWAALARRGQFLVEGLDAERALGNARTDTLAISVDGDHMAPPPTVDHLVQKLSSARVDRVHLTAATSDARALDHFRWAKFPDPVADAVTQWIGTRITRA